MEVKAQKMRIVVQGLASGKIHILREHSSNDYKCKCSVGVTDCSIRVYDCSITVSQSCLVNIVAQ